MNDQQRWELFKSNVEQWAEERGIYEHSTPMTQVYKAISELGNLSNDFLGADKEGIKNSIGSIAVCLVNLCVMSNDKNIQVPTEHYGADVPLSISIVLVACADLVILPTGRSPRKEVERIMEALLGICEAYQIEFMDCCEEAWEELKSMLENE